MPITATAQAFGQSVETTGFNLEMEDSNVPPGHLRFEKLGPQ